MYPGGIELIILGLLIVWVPVLTFFVLRQEGFLRKLFPRAGGNFKVLLEEVLKEIKDLEEFKKESLKDVSKVALLRFNPYKDTGGDQSFSFALLDSLGDGVVITSLHSRAGTRVFAKDVKNGKEGRYEFSEEEREVVKQALKTNV